MNHPITDLAALAGMDIQKTDRDELTDVSGLILDPEVPREFRARYILREAGNPYCFRVGSLGVKLEFMEGSPPLQDVIIGFFRRKKSGLQSSP